MKAERAEDRVKELEKKLKEKEEREREIRFQEEMIALVSRRGY